MKIKLGPIEVEYEGSESFLKEELPELLKAVSDLYQGSTVNPAFSLGHPADATGELSGTKKQEKIDLTTNSIASKLGSKTGADLVMAAAARLTICQGKDKFTRQDILKEMKSATSYYKKTYSNNLSKSLTSLIKDEKLLETAKDTYAIKAITLDGLKERIGK